MSVDELNDDELGTLKGLLADLKKHERRNRLRSAYYDAKYTVNRVGVTIPEQYRNLGMVLGWTGKAVDGLARRCNLARMSWTDGDLDALGYEELVDSNFLFSELSQGRTDAFIHGVSFLITTQGVAGEPKALVHSKSALDATGEWNVRTRKMDNLLSVTGRKNGDVSEAVLYLPNETISLERDNGWKVRERSKHSWGVPVEPQVYRPRASRRMGRSRITRPVMKIQDGAVRALVRNEVHMDIYAIPKLIMLGAESSIFTNADGSPSDAMTMVMGRWFGIPDGDYEQDGNNARADVKQFAAESPEPHIKNLNLHAKLMARETDLPDTDFALMDMSVPTAEASYIASRENLISEAEGATDDFSAPTRSTVMRALAIQDGLSEIPDEWRSIKARWRSPRYISRSAEADAGTKIMSAAPEWLKETRSGLRLLGLSEDDIDEALSERDAALRRANGRAVIEAVANGRRAAVEGDAATGGGGSGSGVVGRVPERASGATAS